MVGVLLAVLLFALVASGCGDNKQDPGSGPSASDPGPVHVHGLGINPKDGALFIATHTGLFRAEKDAQGSERVGERLQDTMGFTVSGDDRFLGSGHPDLRDDLPPLLGLIESRDAGQTWEPVSLLGEADFHVLESNRSLVYGFDSSGDRLMVSRDGGRRWTERRKPESLVSLAIDPGNQRRVIASGQGRLYTSADEGRRWRRVPGNPGLLAWPARGRLYLLAADGRVLVGAGLGTRWRQTGTIGGQPAAFEAEGPRELYAALHDGTVKSSTDGGASWVVRSSP